MILIVHLMYDYTVIIVVKCLFALSENDKIKMLNKSFDQRRIH